MVGNGLVAFGGSPNKLVGFEGSPRSPPALVTGAPNKG